jgi:DNA-binding PadR family transcriptional regulator
MAKLKATPAILYTLLALSEGTRHGYAILADVEKRSRGAVALGPSSLYYTLGRLADRGLIEERSKPSDPHADRDPHAEQRRYFALTSEGRCWLETELALLTGLVDQARALGFEVDG